ncbi:helix-turn-helix transcriptional regulator [Pleomorphomonas koreensis]|uniref:response regulator transcription factor n=1 Tax=Pleomorphomonas koreensis TaxID=257440 RepID=UPI000A02E9D7
MTRSRLCPEGTASAEATPRPGTRSSAGKTVCDSADILGLSDRTVKFYLENVRHKLNCLNTTHAVARAISLGLIPPSYF